MNCQISPHSIAGRMGYSLGRVWKSLVSRLAKSGALTQSGRHKVFVEAAIKLLCLFGIAAIAIALALLIGTKLAVALARSWWGIAEPAITREDSDPDYLGADLYIGDYDSNGHYIGDCKSSD